MGCTRITVPSAESWTEPATTATFWGGYSGLFVDPDGHPREVAHNPGWVLSVDGSVHLR